MENSMAPAPIGTEISWDRVYGDPEKTGRSLISIQGSNKYYLGTCGIVSCANILRMAGQRGITEDTVRYKAQLSGLCKADPIIEKAPDAAILKTALKNGETNADKRVALLNSYNLISKTEAQRIPEIAKYVIAGHGVILSVYAGRLWDDSAYYNELHAVTVVGVKKDAAGKILRGFYICDSGRRISTQDEQLDKVLPYEKDEARYYDWQTLQQALSDMPMNVTVCPIRSKGGSSV